MTDTLHAEARVPARRSLVTLLGEQRAALVEQLRAAPDRSVTELAEHLGISAVATRRHLAVLEDDGLVEARTVRQQRGRPAARYRLTAAADQLLPHRYDALAAEMLQFLREEHGREGVRDFFRWRMRREVTDLRLAVDAEDLHDRLEQLAGALSNAGFEASVDAGDGVFTLVQRHCTIEDVARDHPEICGYEAASFSQALGHDVVVSRRETKAGGAPACVCAVAPADATTKNRPAAQAGTNDDASSAS